MDITSLKRKGSVSGSERKDSLELRAKLGLRSQKSQGAGRLTKEFIEKLIKDPTKLLFRVIYESDKSLDKSVLRKYIPSWKGDLQRTALEADRFFNTYEEKLRHFLESQEWIPYFFEVSPVFRFFCFLGLPLEDLLETWLWYNTLSQEERKFFLVRLLYEIWRNLRKEEELIPYLAKNYENLRKRQK